MSILQKFRMSDAKALSTPMENNLKIKKGNDKWLVINYYTENIENNGTGYVIKFLTFNTSYSISGTSKFRLE